MCYTWGRLWRVSANFSWCRIQQHEQLCYVSDRAQVIPLLRELDWLPFCFRDHFKVLVLTFKALHDMGPGDLRDCLSLISLACHTRSYRIFHFIYLLNVFITHLAVMQSYGFHHLGSYIWRAQGRGPFLLWPPHYGISSPPKWGRLHHF